MISNKYKATLLFFIVCCANPLSASTINIDDKVAHDLDMYRSFLSTSEQIELHGVDDFVTIGTGAGCDFNSTVSSIQDAIDSGPTEIRVASNGIYFENIVIDDQDLILRGGFANCSDAEMNNQDFLNLTEINGSAVPTYVINITGNSTRRLVRLENLTLTGGTVLSPNLGGAITADQTELELQLLRVHVFGNSGLVGAGMFINSGPSLSQTNIDVFAQDLVIGGNASYNAAGGIFCFGAGAQITLTGISTISNNTAEIIGGGGILISSNCELSMYSEVHPKVISGFPGIFNNSSVKEGGGAYLSSGASLYLFGQRMCDDTHCLGSANVPIAVLGNFADNDNLNNESGGGIYMDDTGGGVKQFYANGILLQGNQAGGNGGGVYVGGNSIFEIERRPGACWQRDRCNSIMGNLASTNAGFGGAFYVDHGTMNLSHVYVEGNRADFGTALVVRGENAIVNIENSVFTDNGNAGSDGYFDFQAFIATAGASLSIRHSTIVDNNTTNSVFNIGPTFDSSLSLRSSVVHDPSSGNLFGPVIGELTINCLVSHEAASFTGTNVLVGNPMFVNRALGDFHLAAGSPAVDLCSGIPMLNPSDMDMEPRAWDDPDQADGMGIFDAGADESYLSDVIFQDGFEGF